MRDLPEMAPFSTPYLTIVFPHDDWGDRAGDYASGTNHVLPTYGFARTFSGLGVDDFERRITVQTVTPEGLRHIGPVAAMLAEVEGLDAHARAVTLRLADLADQEVA